MSNPIEDTLTELRRIRMDLTNAQAKLTDAMNLIASMPIPADATRTCDLCGVTTRGSNALAEHIHLSHNGPIPPAWIEAERLAGLDAT